MRLVVLSRVFLARHPWVYWFIVGLLAVAAIAAIDQRVRALDAERERWGRTATVLVAATDLEPAGPISVSEIELPLAVIPSSAIRAIPPGSRIHQRVADGEVLVAADLVPGDGPAAHADAGTLVVGLVDPLSPGAAVGQPVHVAADGVALARQATVVGLVGEVTYVAVPQRDAPTVAAAAQAGVASLLFVP